MSSAGCEHEMCAVKILFKRYSYKTTSMVCLDSVGLYSIGLAIDQYEKSQCFIGRHQKRMTMAMRGYTHVYRFHREGLRFTNGFVHWILHPPMEINEAHVWQKLESPDQEYLLMRSAGFNCYLVCPMTIQHMEYFLPVPANHVLVGKIYDFLTAQLHSSRGDSGEGVWIYSDEFSSFSPHHLLKILDTFMHEYTKQRNCMMRYRKLLQNIV